MLKIKVLGSGLIPRGYGLAPRKEPFMADFTLLATILESGTSLEVHYFNPITGKYEQLSKKNVKKVWDKFSDYEKRHTAATVTQQEGTAPHIPEVKTAVNKHDDMHHIVPGPFVSPCTVNREMIGLENVNGSTSVEPDTVNIETDETNPVINETAEMDQSKETAEQLEEKKTVMVKPMYSDGNHPNNKNQNHNGKHNKK